MPADHWAIDAVRALAAKGLIEGYPDGTFKGDRAASRYEVAMIVARLLAKMEQEHATFATKAELQELQKLADSMRSELEAFGVRVAAIDSEVGRLDQRVDELSRIKFYGRLNFVAVSQTVSGPADIGTSANPGVDWATGRLLIKGQGLTAAGTLGFNAKISDTVTAGGEFVAFTSQGGLGVDSYWGVSAPWLTNPWTGRGTTTPGVSLDSANFPFTRMVIDNFWARHEPSQTKLTLGAFFTDDVASFVLMGPRNPNIHRPRWLPFYGADLKGTIAGPDSGWKYEAYYTLLPELSNYGARSLGGAIRYNFEGGFVRASFAHTYDGTPDNASQLQPGREPLPTVPFAGPGQPAVPTNAWFDSRTGKYHTAVGVQQENTFGLDVDYMIWDEPKLALYAEYGGSQYSPDVSTNIFDTSVSGSLVRAGARANPVAGLNLQLEYLRVDPKYDPFIIGYPLPPGTPVFLPYGAYYSNYYQIHDYINYPNNRQGVRFQGEYRFNDNADRVHLELAALTQLAATTPGQVRSVGNIEPLFPMLQNGEATLGHIGSLGVGYEHRFDNGLRAGVDYYHYTITRDGSSVNNLSLAQDAANLAVSYPIDKQVSLRGNFYYLDYKGHTGLTNTSFSQFVPGVGVDWEAAKGTVFSVDYRYFTLSDRAIAANSYRGSQIITEMKLDF